MQDHLGHLHRFLRDLADGRLMCDHLEILPDDAKTLADALDELDQRRASVTTGGPPAPITPGWQPGDSSRPPTAPPEDEVVVELTGTPHDDHLRQE